LSDNDPDYLFKIEKQIEKKFGSEAIVNPRSLWSEEKERLYLEHIKNEFYNPKKENAKVIEKKGFSVRTKLFIKENRVCKLCSFYSFNKRDDLYLNKYEVCEKCYIKYIEDREEKWAAKQMAEQFAQEKNT